MGDIVFKDILNYSAPCSLEKYLSQWYNGQAKKSIFPYQHFSKIEEIRNQFWFPPREAFYSDLKGECVSEEEYLEAKREFERRRFLPANHPEHIANFSGWLKYYQMLDVIPLTVAIENSFSCFYRHFGANPMVYQSLPGIAFDAAFSLFAKDMPYVSTFTQSFDYVREIFRNNQYGGLVNLFHRQIILGDSDGPRAAKIAPNGKPFTYFR